MPSYSKRVEVPGKTSQELYDRISKEIGAFLERASVGKFDLKHDAAKKEINVSSSMFSATLTCGEGFLSLDGKLSLMAVPFRSKLDDGIDKWIARTFSKA